VREDPAAAAAREEMKRAVAHAALAYVPDAIIGVGSGSTVAAFVAELGASHVKVRGAVPASRASAALLEQHHIPVVDLNDVDGLPVYVDGADWVDPELRLIKGAGAAMTRERLVAAASDLFVCIVDESKLTSSLGGLTIPVEVLAPARAFVAREIARLGGRARLRPGVTTDDGNPILDCAGLHTVQLELLEQALTNLPGVVGHGLFAARGADVLLVASKGHVERRQRT
jgi:ribose 5-phosphate isomerase A